MSIGNYTVQNRVLSINDMMIDATPIGSPKYTLTPDGDRYSVKGGISGRGVKVGGGAHSAILTVEIMPSSAEASKMMQWYQDGEVVDAIAMTIGSKEETTMYNGIISSYGVITRGGRHEADISCWTFTIDFLDHKVQRKPLTET